MTATEALRKQVRKRIDSADEISLRRVSAILEIDQNDNHWWNDKEFVKELDSRSKALSSGEDKGYTVDELRASVEKHKRKQSGK